MKKQNCFCVLLSIICFGLILASCDNYRRSSYSSDNGLKFDTLTIDHIYYLDGDTANPSCNLAIRFEYPIESKTKDLAALQNIFVENMFGVTYDSLSPTDALQQYIKNFVDNYKRDALIYRENVGSDNILLADGDSDEHYLEEEVLDKTDDAFYSYNEVLSDSIVYNGHGVVSFQVKQSNNKNGSASYNSYRNFSINLKTESLLTEGDIFIPGYDQALRKLFISALLDQNGVKTVSELEELGYFGINEITPNNNFMITDKGVIYTFNKGEYSAYQLKAPALFIPYNLMTAILRKNTVVANLAGVEEL